MNFDEIERNRREFEKFRMEEARKEARRKVDESICNAKASVCAAMAHSNMVTALVTKDAKTAAEALVESMRWQMNVALAYAGFPLIEKESRP